MENLYEIKETIRGMVGYSTLKAWESVKISYSVDGWSYTEILTINFATVLPDLRTEDLIFASWSFQYIQFKFELWGNGATTPSFYNLDLVFNNNIKTKKISEVMYRGIWSKRVYKTLFWHKEIMEVVDYENIEDVALSVSEGWYSGDSTVPWLKQPDEK